MTVPYDPTIDFLVNRRFPDADEVRERYYSEAHPCWSHDLDRMREIETYKLELSLKPPAELQSLEEEERKEEERERFYNQPNANADFSYWSKMPCWELDEAVALSFGKCPKTVNSKTLLQYSHDSPFVAKYHQLRDLVERAKRMEQLSEPVLPTLFIAWARQNEIAFPASLEAAVATRGQQAPRKLASEGHNGKDLHAKERETVLKLVITMAVKGYSYKPTAARSDVPAEIANDVHALGLSIDDDTVRKWLKEAAELLPRAEPK